MKALLLIILILSCSAIATAQSKAPQTTDCYSTHTFGAGVNKFSFCISSTGNILHLESPASFRQIEILEGYALCSSKGTHAWSTAADGNTWATFTYFQPNGTNTLPLTITGTGIRGELQVAQTFEANFEEREIKITTTIKNISSVSFSAVRWARYFDGDLSNDREDDLYDSDADSVWGRDSGTGTGHHGIMLSALTLAVSHTQAVENWSDWNPSTGLPSTAKTCTPIVRSVPTALGDYIGRLTYNLGSLAAGQSRTVKVVYRRF
jgi:hypothetical protein